jgi:disulfide oxidoreductase YuzD
MEQVLAYMGAAGGLARMAAIGSLKNITSWHRKALSKKYPQQAL